MLDTVSKASYRDELLLPSLANPVVGRQKEGNRHSRLLQRRYRVKGRKRVVNEFLEFKRKKYFHIGKWL